MCTHTHQQMENEMKKKLKKLGKGKKTNKKIGQTKNNLNLKIIKKNKNLKQKNNGFFYFLEIKFKNNFGIIIKNNG